MSDDRQITKTELMDQIDRGWVALEEGLRRLTPEQLTNVRDPEGWSAKDHLTHLAAWERSVVYFLEGKPRHEGLGVDRTTYETGEEKINAVVQQQTGSMSLDDALAALRDVHTRLLVLLEPLSDEDLRKPYRAFLPDEPGEGDGPPAVQVIYGNTADHFREHLGWITELVER